MLIANKSRQRTQSSVSTIVNSCGNVFFSFEIRLPDGRWIVPLFISLQWLHVSESGIFKLCQTIESTNPDKNALSIFSAVRHFWVNALRNLPTQKRVLNSHPIIAFETKIVAKLYAFILYRKSIVIRFLIWIMINNDILANINAESRIRWSLEEFLFLDLVLFRFRSVKK